MTHILKSVPSIMVDVGQLTEPSEIRRIMKSHNIQDYLYRVVYDDSIVVKYGMSCPVDKTQYGDRVYRQIGHMYGWDKKLASKSGEEWCDIEKAYYDQYGVILHKDKLKITIWDLTNYDFKTINRKDEINVIEGIMIQHHIDAVGTKPIGNVRDEHTIDRSKRTKIAVNIWDALVESEPEVPKKRKSRAKAKTTV